MTNLNNILIHVSILPFKKYLAMSQLNLYQRPTHDQHREPDRFSFSSWTLDTNTSDGGTSDTNSSECSTESSYSDVLEILVEILVESNPLIKLHLNTTVLWVVSWYGHLVKKYLKQYLVACLINMALLSMRTVLCPLYHSTIHKRLLQREK